jgi:hypothetical protein
LAVLGDATTIRVLRAFASARSAHGDYQMQWSPELRQALVERVGASDLSASVSEGDLASEVLLLLAAGPENQPPLAALSLDNILVVVGLLVFHSIISQDVRSDETVLLGQRPPRPITHCGVGVEVREGWSWGRFIRD